MAEKYLTLRLEGNLKTLVRNSPFCREKNEYVAAQTSWKDLMWYLFQI